MTILHAIGFFISTFAQVALLGFQSRNVNTGQYLAAGLSSLAIGTAQLFTVRTIALSNPLEVWAITSIAGPAGILTAMLMHRRIFKN